MKTSNPEPLFTKLLAGVRLWLLPICSLFVMQSLSAQEQLNTIKKPSAIITEALQQKDEQTPVLPAGASAEWYQQAIANLSAREYFFQPFERAGFYGAANHAQNLGFLINPSGYAVKNIVNDNKNIEAWEYHFSVQRIGKASSLSALSKKFNKIYTEQSLEYDYSNVNIVYQNNEKGLRQNFIFNHEPAGTGRLQVEIKLAGSLSAAIAGQDQLLLSSLKDKQTRLIYDHLKVWDANHRALAATMQLSGKNKLVISVNDSAAVYPVTVDPLNNTPNWTASGNGLLFPLLNDLTTPVMYGYSVAAAGDVNGDGIGDIIVGAPLYVKILSIVGNTFNPVNVGAAFIYMGTTSGPVLTPSEALQPSTIAGAFAGFSVSTAGDMNGDGRSEVMISAPGDRVNLTVGVGIVAVASGKVYVYDGSLFDGNVNTQNAPAKSLSLGQPDFGPLALVPANPLYGWSITDAGDLNGDGFDDIAIGSPAYVDLATLTLGGKVDIYNGSITGVATLPARTIKGGLLNGLFGYSVSGVGKVNNDIYNDLIVGAPGSVGVLNVGAAYVFHSSASGITATTASAANTILTAPGLLSRTLFGFSVAAAGDVNGDGYNDVIVGEPLSLETTLALQVVAVGKAHIFYGSPGGIQTTGETALTSPRSPNLLGLVQGNLLYGYSVGSAGDMNCDGLSDVVVGEPGGTAISLGTGALGLVSTNALSGAAYVYAGNTGTGPSNTPMMTIQQTGTISAANLIGYSVGVAGDVNGDGHPDLLIGAPNGTLSLPSSITGIIGNAIGYVTSNSVGSAYVYFGCNLSILPVRLLTFDGQEQQGGGLLFWTATGSDKNVSFEVERSTDAVSFTKIGIVQAKPVANGKESYSFTDKVLPAQNNYYRLKMINAAVKSTYSKVVLIRGKENAGALRVSPNPAREAVQLHFNNLPAGNYTLVIMNISGQTTLKTKFSLSNGVYENKTIDRTPSMPAGTYFIRLINQYSETVSTSKIILQ